MPKNIMTKNTAVNLIRSTLAGIGDVKIGHHADLRHFGHNEARRGCYAEIREPYADSIRLYAASYAALAARVVAYANDNP